MVLQETELWVGLNVIFPHTLLLLFGLVFGKWMMAHNNMWTVDGQLISENSPNVRQMPVFGSCWIRQALCKCLLWLSCLVQEEHPRTLKRKDSGSVGGLCALYLCILFRHNVATSRVFKEVDVLKPMVLLAVGSYIRLVETEALFWCQRVNDEIGNKIHTPCSM